MKTYRVYLKYTNDSGGHTWHSTTATVKAESDYTAMEMAKTQYSRYRYVEVTEIREI